MKIGIVGAGIIGRLLAFEFLNAGNHVTIFDKDSQKNCSAAAAGLLTPVTELEKNSLVIYHLGVAALQQYWPEILSRLNSPVYFQRQGSLVLSHPQDEVDLIRYIEMISSKLSDSNSVIKLDKENIAHLEPELSKFSAGYYVSQEGQIDNQQLLDVIKLNLCARGIVWRDNVLVEDVSANQISVDNINQHFDFVFDCRGLGAKNNFNNLRSVRGELIWLQAPDVSLTRPVRFLHPRYSLYIVPRPGHHYLIGASEIESDDLGEISVRTSLELLTAAYYVHPGFCEAKIVKTVTQCRPTLSNHLPKIKYQPGLIAINGLYRHGYLISPTLVAEVMNWFGGGMAAIQYPELWRKLMLEICFNGDKLLLADAITLQELLLDKGYIHDFFAVAMNRVFVPKHTYSTVILKINDVVDIIMPMQGG